MLSFMTVSIVLAIIIGILSQTSALFDSDERNGSIANLFKEGSLGIPIAHIDDRELGVRIVGGQDTVDGEYPFMAAIVFRTGGLLCGGSILNELHILTAAHCVRGQRPEGLQVMLGLHRLSDQKNSVSRDVERFWYHRDFDFTTFDWDVAVIKMASAVTFNKMIQPVCLSGVDAERYVGYPAIVVGWGATKEELQTPSDILRKVSVPIISNTVCQKPYRFLRQITERMICAGLRQGGKDSCQGDSGGPMLVKEGKTLQQLGIVSWGNGCARALFYGVYTRICKVLPWITRITRVKTC